MRANTVQFDSRPERLDRKNLPQDFPAKCLSYTQPREGGTAPHMHDCMEIGLCVEGEGVLMIGGRMHTFLPGSIDVIGAGCVHDACVVPHSPRERPSRWKFIFVSPEALGIAAPDGGRLSGERRARTLFELMYAELEERKDGWREVFTELLCAFLRLMQRAEPEDGPSGASLPPEIAECLRYIGHAYASPITVEELAAACHMSRSGFCRAFRQAIGMPPLRYVNHLRLTVARHLVLHTDEPILRIAGECGFGALSSFNRHFQREYAMQPREMRKNAKRLSE